MFNKKDKDQNEDSSIFQNEVKISGEYNFEFKFKAQGQANAIESVSKNII